MIFTTYLLLKPLPKFSAVKSSKAFLLAHSHSPNPPADPYSVFAQRQLRGASTRWGHIISRGKSWKLNSWFLSPGLRRKWNGCWQATGPSGTQDLPPVATEKGKEGGFSPLRALQLAPHSLPHLVTYFTSVWNSASKLTYTKFPCVAPSHLCHPDC